MAVSGEQKLGAETDQASHDRSMETGRASLNERNNREGEEKSAENLSKLEAATPASNSRDEEFEAATRVKSHVSTASSTYPSMPLLHEAAFVTILCMAQLLTQAGLAVSIAPLYIIGQSFGNPSPGQLSWFPAAYGLTSGTFILVAGRVGDIVGHKTMFLIGFAWYSLWSLIAGLTVYSKSQIFFDFCRAMQGMGPAILLPCALALLGRSYPPGKRKGMVFAIFGATAPNGFLIGALFSSLVGQLAWWPWAYWLLAIFCLMCTVAAFFIIPESSNENSGHGEQTFDYLGAFVGVAGLVLFNVAWNQAPVVGWGTPYVIVLLILGILFFIAFILVERRVRQPILPVQGLSPQIGVVLGCIALGWANFGIWLFYQWQFLGELRGYTPLSIVAQLSPAGPSGLCAALTSGFLITRVPPGFMMAAAMGFFCLGSILFATMAVDQTYWANTFVANLLTPWGMDISFPTATLLLSNFVPKRHQGIAASLVATVVNYSISIGLGIGGTVQTYVNDDGKDLLKGFRGAWYAGIGLSGCGILLSSYFIIAEIREQAGKVTSSEETEDNAEPGELGNA